MDIFDTDNPMIKPQDETRKRPLNILHLDCTTGYGGQERDHIAEAKGMNSRGHRYILGGRPGTPFFEEAKSRTETIAFPMRSNFDQETFSRLRQFILGEQIDVLVTTSYIDSFLGYVSAISLGERRPLVIRQRHLLNVPRNMIPFRQFCDRLVVVSEALRIFFMEKHIPFWHVVTIPRGIAIKDKEEAQEVGTLGRELDIAKELSGKKVLLQIGVFQRDKGHHLMLDALVPLFREFSDLHMIFLGTGPLFEEIQIRARRLLGESGYSRLHFMGSQDPAPYLAIADLVLLPSVRDSFPLVVLEAISSKKEVVAFRVGGVPEMANVLPGIHLVAPKDPMAFARKVSSLLLRTTVSFKGKEVARELMENAFSIETCNIRTEAVYRNALELLRQGKINQNPYLEKGGLADPCLS
jgi:glycosyltransferase involved in cell wall biosynthesis